MRYEENVVSVDNSYHGFMAPNQIYTGNWEDTSAFSSIGINVTCQNPVTLRVHFSDDQVNNIQFDIAITGTTYDFNTPSRKRFMKFTIINGSLAQTALHLHIKYHYVPVSPFAAPFTFPLFDQSTAVTVRAGLMARDSLGVLHNITLGPQSTATSLPVTLPTDQVVKTNATDSNISSSEQSGDALITVGPGLLSYVDIQPPALGVSIVKIYDSAVGVSGSLIFTAAVPAGFPSLCQTLSRNHTYGLYVDLSGSPTTYIVGYKL